MKTITLQNGRRAITTNEALRRIKKAGLLVSEDREPGKCPTLRILTHAFDRYYEDSYPREIGEVAILNTYRLGEVVDEEELELTIQLASLVDKRGVIAGQMAAADMQEGDGDTDVPPEGSAETVAGAAEDQGTPATEMPWDGVETKRAAQQIDASGLIHKFIQEPDTGQDYLLAGAWYPDRPADDNVDIVAKLLVVSDPWGRPSVSRDELMMTLERAAALFRG
jgi:hypothetical protein